MNRGQLPTKFLSASNWGGFDHASHASQLLADNYCVYISDGMSVCMSCLIDSVMYVYVNEVYS